MDEAAERRAVLQDDDFLQRDAVELDVRRRWWFRAAAGLSRPPA